MIVDLLLDGADHHAEDTAVASGDHALTYHELLGRALRVTSLLNEHGVGPGDRVGISVHKSVDSMATVYGVLAAGAAYVPLDPGSSPTYAAAILASAGAVAVLTDRPGRFTDQPERPDRAVIDVAASHDPTIVEAEPVRAEPDDLAYVMFTSGSTGAPKGIMHTHSSCLAYARRAARTYGLTPSDRLANIAPLHFDQSTFELFAGPSVGATSVFVPEPYLRLPASLSKLVETEQITVWYSVPFVLNQLAERGVLEERDLGSVRWVLFGGEVMPAASLATLMGHFDRARFSNVYGPAEVNQCTFHHVTQPPSGDGPIPIGHPWDGTEIQVTVEGELLVRTDTMMTGYWQRPDLTDQAMIDGWYRTGDLVELASDGALIFAGRVDNQVKVRGQRIELEAVDAVLAAHPDVAHAVSVVDRGPGGLLVVAALVVASNGASETADSLVTHAAARLPPAAVPHRIQFVPELPLTSTGKIDRSAAATLLEAVGTP